MRGNPGLSGQSDRELVLAFQAGDRAAYEELYRRHHARVARVCYRFLHNTPDAEEAAQETFLKAFQALPRFNGQYQVGAWLARIAANVCVDHLRVKSRSHLVALPNEDRILVVEQGPEEILVGGHPKLDIVIDDIQPLHASALKMRGEDGLSHVEIAGRLNMTPAQVKALLHRARSSFKKAWDKAQGWLLAPIIKARSMDRPSHVSQATSNIAVVSAQAPALAEKAAASVLIVMVALSGPLTVSRSAVPPISVPDAPLRGERASREMALAPRLESQPALTKSAAAEEEGDLQTLVAALPQTLTSTIEGGKKNIEAQENGDDSDDETEEAIIPPTVKETPKKAREVVQEVLDGLEDPTE